MFATTRRKLMLGAAALLQAELHVLLEAAELLREPAVLELQLLDLSGQLADLALEAVHAQKRISGVLALGLRAADRRDLCAAFQSAVADVLAEKSRRALALSPVPVLAVAGLGDLLAFADGNEKLAAFRAPLLAYRARYGCDPTG